MKIDSIVQRYTCFEGLNDMIAAKGSYRPSLDVRLPTMARLADAYDQAMEELGDSRRAYRFKSKRQRSRKTK